MAVLDSKNASRRLWQQRPVTYTTSTTLRVGNQVGIASLIVPNSRHGPSGAMNTPQYKDGTSMAAPDSENSSRRLSGSQLPGPGGRDVAPSTHSASRQSVGVAGLP